MLVMSGTPRATFTHSQKASSIYKHHPKKHNTVVPNNFLARFNVIKKCTYKFDCLVIEMLCIQKLKPSLNVQSDSLLGEVFMQLAWHCFM